MIKFNKPIPYIFLTFSLILLLYVFYRSNILNNGVYYYYYKQYYFITIALVIFSLLSFFFKPIFNKLILYFIMIFFLAGYSLELIFFYFNNKAFNEKLKNLNDTRSFIGVYEDLTNEGEDILPAGYHKYHEKLNIFSFGGVSNYSTLFCNENGYWIKYFSDKYGFRNPSYEWKKENKILLIGDSTTAGACVENNDSLAGNFRNLLMNENKNIDTGIINMGVGARGPVVEYANLIEYIDIVQPDKVIWLYHESNDLIELKNELQIEFLKKYLNETNFKQNLHLKQKQIDKSLKKNYLKSIKQQKNKLNYRELKNWYSLSYFLKLSYLRLKILHRDSFSFDQKTLNEFKKIMEKTKKLTDKHNAELYFVYLPDYWRYVASNNNGSFYNYNDILEIINKLNIKLIDVNEKFFLNEKDPLEYWPFRRFGHYNVKGYRKVSNTIYDSIKW